MILFSASIALAGSRSCYTLSEAEAEQGIRIHSELMVIGLNCQHMAKAANNKNLYAAYREFTAKNGAVFAEYDNTMLGYFKRSGARDPEAALNTLRTQFANKISLDAAKMRPDLFCRAYAPRIQKVATMNQAYLRKWAGTFFPSHPVAHPICEN
jgi:hypothetical protein